jgi:hypothetical protein
VLSAYLKASGPEKRKISKAFWQYLENGYEYNDMPGPFNASEHLLY